MRMKNKILQVVGYSQTGKTAIIQTVLAELTKIGYQVAVIKSAKSYKRRENSKDTDKHLDSGAKISAGSFNNSLQITIAQDYTLQQIIEIIDSISKNDVILIEGFKMSEYPKVLLWKSNELHNLNKFNLNELLLVYCSQKDYNNYEQLKELSEKKSVPIVFGMETLVKEIVKYLTS